MSDKRVGCYLKEVGVLDDDSVLVALDFDGLDDPDGIVAKIKARKAFGSKVTIWDVIAVVLLMYAANRKKEEEEEENE